MDLLLRLERIMAAQVDRLLQHSKIWRYVVNNDEKMRQLIAKTFGTPASLTARNRRIVWTSLCHVLIQGHGKGSWRKSGMLRP